MIRPYYILLRTVRQEAANKAANNYSASSLSYSSGTTVLQYSTTSKYADVAGSAWEQAIYCLQQE